MESLDEKDDKELVQGYLDGQEEVLPYLINKHLKSVYRFVFGLVLDEAVAEDITQDVFVKVWKKLKSYDSNHSFKTWLFAVARNTTIDYFRKKKDIVFSKFDSEEDNNFIAETLVDEEPLIDEVLSRVQDMTVFNEAIKQLQSIYREVLIMRYTNDLSVEEISEILKRPIETVKSQHRRGILHLKELLSRMY
jgi:RNA polymerase sigma-70 factor (ECF subfamily)